MKYKDIKEELKRDIRLFVQRLIKMAKEQIVVGRNYGWTQDSMSQELYAFIQKQLDSNTKRVKKEILSELAELAIHEEEDSPYLTVKLDQIIKLL